MADMHAIPYVIPHDGQQRQVFDAPEALPLGLPGCG
jgi:hypothetical protein